MIFKTEFNPWDYSSLLNTIERLQEVCRTQTGCRFDPTKVAMGQIQPNGEIWWFEGFVDDENIKKAKQVKECMLPDLKGPAVWSDQNMVGFAYYFIGASPKKSAFEHLEDFRNIFK